MNQYRNYGNYGNRRYAGGMDDCGCAGNNSARMMQNKGNCRTEKDCGCVKAEMKHEPDCDCKKEAVMSGTDCGCMKKEDMKEHHCGCKEKEDVMSAMDCDCMKKPEYKEHDCDCHEEKCGCSVEAMYREMKQGGMCCETDMPGKALAMAYVPWQSWGKLYEICEGFATGTIFKELDLEFYGRRCN